MPQPLILVSDVHGCFKTLTALVQKARAQAPDGQVVLLGDLVDRGPRSKEVVEWAMREKVLTVLGNHDHMMVDYYLNQQKGERSDYGPGIWLANGGMTTITSFGHVSAPVLAWLGALPTYIIPPDYPDLLLSHTGWGGPVIKSVFGCVWERSTAFPKDGYYRVFGHTPNREPIITDTYAMIDTACAYGGALTAMIWPTREIVRQEMID